MSLSHIPLDFDFLTWVDRITHFPGTFQETLARLGVDPGEAFFIARSEAVKEKHSIVALYQDFGSAYGAAFDAYIVECWLKWKELQA